MKNAFVLVAHTGDKGMQQEGGIMLDLSNDRFDALEKIGLVREAKTEEIKKWQPSFEAEADGEKPAGTVVIAADELQDLRDRVQTLGSDLFDARDLNGKLEADLNALRDTNADLTGQIAAHEATIANLTTERDEARAAAAGGGSSDTAGTGETGGEAAPDGSGGEKADEMPDNANAPAPSNKAAARASTKA